MILVTGGTGFIGSHLLVRLAADRRPVGCLIRRSRVARSLPVGVQPFEGDLATGEGLDAALREADTVLHLAGVTKALRPADYYSGNAQATETLAHAVAARRDIRFVHVSSLAAIGPADPGRPVQEDAEPRPITNYGQSKLEAEKVVRRFLPDAVIVRPPVVYGPRDTDVFRILKSVSQGLAVQIAGCERWFSAIYVEDLVDGLLAAAAAPNASGQAYFLTHPKALTWTDLTLEAASIMRRTCRTVRVPPAFAYGIGWCAEAWSRLTASPGIVSREKVREGCCAAWLCDHRKAAAELGFVARTALPEGLAKTLAWYKEAGWLSY